MARGFTVLEMVVSLAVLGVLAGVTFAIAGKLIDYVGEQDTRQAFVLDATSALAKLDVELRESGEAVIGAVRYPYVTPDGDELRYVHLDSPPCTFDGSPDLRWNPSEIAIRVQNGELGMWVDGVRRTTFVTKVGACTFTLAGRTIAVDLELVDPDAKGAPVRERFRRIIVMRN